jgi:hypothetical protein
MRIGQNMSINWSRLSCTRRQSLSWGALGVSHFLLPGCQRPKLIFGHPSSDLGHLPPSLATPATRVFDVIVVGGGIAGLSCARQLRREGIENIAILELESEVGGHSRSGQSTNTKHPLGAHYVPALDPQWSPIHEFFEESGVITGKTHGKIQYRETYQCHDPEERLWIYGSWQDGLLPHTEGEDKRQILAFQETMDGWRRKKAKDGRWAFTIPVDESSQDFRELDRISMDQYCREQGWNSPYLRWFVNYACRDDFGTTSSQTSAWAGIHYFAARKSAVDEPVLTWPEGNDFLVQKLRTQAQTVSLQCVALRVQEERSQINVQVWNAQQRKSESLSARYVALCTPQQVNSKLLGRDRDTGFEYAPWAVANTVVPKLQRHAWDNVNYHSDSLGYVVANHQNMERGTNEITLTQYWPLSDLAPRAMRQVCGAISAEQWQNKFIRELTAVHPEFKGEIRSVAVWIWPHAMISPRTGWMWSSSRLDAQRPLGRIHFAHSDLSGISIFEEAFMQGFNTARDIAKRLRA